MKIALRCTPTDHGTTTDNVRNASFFARQNREDALSPTGEEQVVASCELLKQGTRPPTLVKYSLAASSIDAANIVGRELKLGRDRLVPEFTFLDPRAIGAWDMSARDTTLSAVWAMDFDEAGNDGLKGRPPAHEDGTPNEVLADQAIRLRQLMSILESQYSGDTILLIFPDSTGPALLSAMIAGIPYSRAHQLEYEPGEIRFEVTMDSTLSLMQKKELEEGSKFRETLRQGRKHLQQLRATEANGGIVVNLKDQKLDEERLAIEQALEAKEEERLRTEQIQQEKRQARQREMEKAFNARESGGFNAPVTAWGAAAAALASVAGVSWSRGDDYNMGAQSSDTLLAINSTDLLIGRQKRRSNSESVLELSANSVTGGLYASTPFGTTTDIRSATGNNRIRSISSPVDRQVAADRAMEEYMNKDDGADDWLASISQMIADPEFLVNEETFLASTADSLPPKPLPSGNFSIGVHEDVKEPINKFDTELLASAEELPSSWDDGGFQ